MFHQLYEKNFGENENIFEIHNKLYKNFQDIKQVDFHRGDNKN